jgi:cytochrome c oxidase subunit 1
MPRRYYDYLPQFEDLHRFSSIGAMIIGVGVLVMLITLVKSLLSGPKAPPNPWGSAALEWQTSSPPPLENFVRTPVVTRGPYDYHLATDAELYTGFPEDYAASSKANAKA